MITKINVQDIIKVLQKLTCTHINIQEEKTTNKIKIFPHEDKVVDINKMVV